MTLRGAIFIGFICGTWGITVQNADYFGLPEPWGFLLTTAGAFLLGIAAPRYRGTGL